MKTDASVEACETVLQGLKDYNQTNRILRSQTVIIDRLLSRRLEMKGVYHEVWRKLGTQPPALEVFFDLILNVAAFWNPEKAVEEREAKRRLQEINLEIAKAAEKLGKLLTERNRIHNTSGFFSTTHYDIIEVIDAASIENSLFQSYVKDGLSQIGTRFDTKYWPSLSEVVMCLAQDAKTASIFAHDARTVAQTSGTRGSTVDFFKALFVAFDEMRITREERGPSQNRLPHDFRLSDKSLASLANCALDLAPEEILSGDRVKRMRQSMRDAARQKE